MYARTRQQGPGYANAPGPRQGNPQAFPPQNYQQQANFPSPMNHQGNYKMNATQFVKAQQPLLPPPLQQQQQQQVSSTPTAQKLLKPILKQTPPASPVTVGAPANPQTTPPVQNLGNQTMAAPNLATKTEQIEGQQNDESMELQEDGQPVRRWKRKATGPVKINRKLKRQRLNQKLRKTIQPKNAIMVLNEMKTGVQFTFPENQAPMSSSLFLVHAEIDGKVYVGQGLSKPLARQNAAENALKSLLLEKMSAASMKTRVDPDESVSTVESKDVTKEDGEGDVSMENASQDDSDDIPWSSLACFALHKLFLEWQNQGTVVPVPRPGVVSSKIKKEHKPHVQKELPPNALSIHPVMLLNQMRPGLVYVEANRAGNPPNTIFTLAVEVDGTAYHGTAKNKRDAKKSAAKAALFALYNLTFPDEEKNETLTDVSM